MVVRHWKPLAAVILLCPALAACAPSDADRDGDVDQDDFGVLQRCYSDDGVASTDPACNTADLDDDGDVDSSDLDVLADCKGGPDVPADPHCTPQGYPYFPRTAAWYQDISNAPVDTESSTVINWLASVGGWGTGAMRIDYSIEVLTADASAPFRAFTKTGDFYTPDCDDAPVPVPEGGALEGESGYECESDGDCHLIVIHEPTQKLYEMWRANIVGDTFYGGCLAIWDMTREYGPTGRGEHCTSADAAGFPIAPLLFTADEVAAGWIDHAIRFILPNARIRAGVYVHPATHIGAPSGPSGAPPYGARLRLKASFDLNTLPNDGSRVVARAMQRYGILLSDGGNIALTAQSDRFTTHKWDGLLETRDLQSIRVTDFEMIDGGPRITYTGDCVRVP